MAIRLTPQQLENVKNYKYKTNDWTPLDLAFNPWWEFAVNSLSKVSLFFFFSIKFYIIENRTQSHYFMWSHCPTHRFWYFVFL